MYPRHPDPSNMKFSTLNWGGSLQLTGGNPDFSNSTRLLYNPIQMCWTVFVPLLLGTADVATAGKFSPPHFIFVDMPQIMGISHSVETG